MQHVEIRVAGQIDKDWTEWFEGFSISHPIENETLLSGEVADQAAIYGIIAKLRDLGLNLIFVSTTAGD